MAPRLLYFLSSKGICLPSSSHSFIHSTSKPYLFPSFIWFITPELDRSLYNLVPKFFLVLLPKLSPSYLAALSEGKETEDVKDRGCKRAGYLHHWQSVCLLLCEWVSTPANSHTETLTFPILASVVVSILTCIVGDQGLILPGAICQAIF